MAEGQEIRKAFLHNALVLLCHKLLGIDCCPDDSKDAETDCLTK